MSKVKVDISEYNRMVDRLTGKEMDKAMISAVRSGGQIIRRRTIQNFGSGTAFKAFNVYKDRNGSTKRLPLVRLNVKAQDSEESKVLDDMEKRVMRAVIRIGRKK